jgi:prophage DNA circulation protein
MNYIFKDETEKFQDLKTELKNRIAVVEAEQRALEEEIKAIRQKMAIQELLKSVRRRRDELAGLPLQRAKRKE